MDKKISSSFLEKLKGLGVQIGTELVTVPKKNISINDVVEGHVKTNNFGSTFITETIYPNGSYHGKMNLLEANDFDLIFRWAKATSGNPPNAARILFLDTETSSLAGGAGTFVFMVGLGFYSDDSFKVVQIFLEDPDKESAFLYALEELAAGFDTLVTYNGKSFDIPVLKNRYFMNQYPNPFEQFGHIDLLHLARRIWKNRLPSCRLADIELDILDFKRSEEEIPGWLVPQIYHDYLYSGDARPLSGVFYHNQNDIVSLAALIIELSRLLADPYNAKYLSDLISIGKLFEDLNLKSNSQEIYRYCTRLNLTRDQEIELFLRSANLHNRNHEWDQAMAYWSKAADMGSVEACIEISKLLEHRKKDPEKAFYYAQLGGKYRESLPKKTNVRHNTKDIEKRISRLQSKIKSKNKDD